MPLIKDESGMLTVVLGVGDLRIATMGDMENGLHMIAIGTGYKPAPIGQPVEFPATQEERWEVLAQHPPQIILASVTKQGIDNLINILQEVSDRWGVPFVPPSTPVVPTEEVSSNG